MIFLDKKISKLRKISFYLFLVPTVALIISLLLHNTLVSFKFSSKSNFYKGTFPIITDCNQNNKFCDIKADLIYSKTTKFDQCEKYYTEDYIEVKNKKYSQNEYTKKFINNKDYNPGDLISLNIKNISNRTDKKNYDCILNSKLFIIYKYLPSVFYFTEKLKNNDKYISATSNSVMPFIYGETSISNIVKRYPVNLIFKPLMYITSILMLLYWFNYHDIFKNFNKIKRLEKFTFFGVGSSLFLLFHVIFLGTAIDNEVFTKIRKLVLVLFILFEILAQFFLTRRLYLTLDKLKFYIHKKILTLKIIFVSIVIFSSVFILSILSFFDLDSKVDYILEWNYFFFLLFFYFLSVIIWKKKNLLSYPSSTKNLISKFIF